MSVFTDKEKIPNEEDLQSKLGPLYSLWIEFRNYVYEKYPGAKEEWNYPGKKYGWSFRIKDKKRAIIYLLPRDGFFKVAFVFGQKATDQVLASPIPGEIKQELMDARVYAEGRGIRIDIKDESKNEDIKRLVDIKLAN
ncbi:MAG: DUF3788 domain-containing protein [Bacteroidales bacterium]|nr:DUF3788 domain-containing protein [Bacteroidales bacterium]